eukprot:SAG31_NODE_131_length_23419_cov_38.760087_8_plen_202_part_00
MSQEADPTDNTRTLTIRGTPETVARGRQLVEQVLAERSTQAGAKGSGGGGGFAGRTGGSEGGGVGAVPSAESWLNSTFGAPPGMGMPGPPGMITAQAPPGAMMGGGMPPGVSGPGMVNTGMPPGAAGVGPAPAGVSAGVSAPSAFDPEMMARLIQSVHSQLPSASGGTAAIAAPAPAASSSAAAEKTTAAADGDQPYDPFA